MVHKKKVEINLKLFYFFLKTTFKSQKPSSKQNFKTLLKYTIYAYYHADDLLNKNGAIFYFLIIIKDE